MGDGRVGCPDSGEVTENNRLPTFFGHVVDLLRKAVNTLTTCGASFFIMPTSGKNA